MSPEHHPVHAVGPGHSGGPALNDDPDYWNSLIPEKPAADFLDVTPRALQKWRQKGGGPEYIRISSRCIRYTRLMLKIFADARRRRSTSDPGQAA